MLKYSPFSVKMEKYRAHLSHRVLTPLSDTLTLLGSLSDVKMKIKWKFDVENVSSMKNKPSGSPIKLEGGKQDLLRDMLKDWMEQEGWNKN